MPRVPQADLPSIGLQTGAMPQFQASQVAPAQNFMGQQLQQLGQGVEQLGAGMYKMGDRINDARARAADNELSEFNRAALTQYRNLQGKDAVQARDKFVQDMEQKRKELADSLDNEWQRGSFEQRAAYRSLQFNTYVDDHYQGQATAFEIGEASASLKANVQDFSEQYKSAATMPVGSVADNPYFKDALRQVDVIAAAKGIPADSAQYRLMREEAEDSLHVAAMMTMTEDQSQASRKMAREYFAANKDRISQRNRTDIEKAIQRMDIDDDAFVLSQSLASKDGIGLQKTTLDQMRLAGKIDGPTYNATLEKLQSSFSLQKQADADAKNKLTDEYELSLSDAIRNNDTWASWSARNPNLVTQLGQRNMLREAEAFFSNKGRFTTDEGRQFLMQARQDPRSLPAYDWPKIYAKWRPHLSNEDMLTLEGMMAGANSLPMNSRLPSGRTTQEVYNLTDKTEFNNLLVETATGVKFDPEWDKESDEYRNYFKLQLEVEKRLNMSGVDMKRRDLMLKWAGEQAPSKTGALKADMGETNFLFVSQQSDVSPLLLAARWDEMTVEQKQGITWNEKDAAGVLSKSLTFGEWTNNPELRARAINNARAAAEALSQKEDANSIRESEVLKEAVAEATANNNEFTRGLDKIIRTHLQMEMAVGAQRVKEEQETKAKKFAVKQALTSGLEQTSYHLPTWVRSHLKQGEPVTLSAALLNLDQYFDMAKEEGVFGPKVTFGDPITDEEVKSVLRKAIIEAAGTVDQAPYDTYIEGYGNIVVGPTVDITSVNTGSGRRYTVSDKMMQPAIPMAEAEADRWERLLRKDPEIIKSYFQASGLWREFQQANRPIWSLNRLVYESNIDKLQQRLLAMAAEDGVIAQGVDAEILSGKRPEFYRWFNEHLLRAAQQLKQEQASDDIKAQRAEEQQALRDQYFYNKMIEAERLTEILNAQRKSR